MEINFNGYQENVLTFECESTVSKGDFVAMSASGKVTKPAESSNFIGVVQNVKDGYAAVQLDGYVEAPKTGTINVGYCKLVTAENGVKTGSSGSDRLVIYSDDTTVGFIL